MVMTLSIMISYLITTHLQICCGGMHTIALTKTGEVFSWGCNDEGGLGRDTPEDEDCFLPGKVGLTVSQAPLCSNDFDCTILEINIRTPNQGYSC